MWLFLRNLPCCFPFFCRIFVCTLQHYVLYAFRKVLVSSPALLDIFRGEGVWELIFSETFFYSRPLSTECLGKYCKYDEVPPWNLDIYSSSNSITTHLHRSEVDIVQIEVISFVEFAATLNDSSHNLVGLLSFALHIIFVEVFNN